MYHLGPRVADDLRVIWDYIAQANPDAADRVVDGLVEKFILLGTQPELGRERREFRGNLRSLAVGSYVIFYRVKDSDIEIIRVLHGSRDLRRLLR